MKLNNELNNELTPVNPLKLNSQFTKNVKKMVLDTDIYSCEKNFRKLSSFLIISD